MRISDWGSDVCSSDLYVKLMRTAWPSSPRWRTGECQPSTFGCDGRHGEALRRSCRGSHFDLRLRRGRHSERSEEHTSELQSLMRISYAVFCLKKKKIKHNIQNNNINTTKITTT